jgi:RNA recognition motif-containing protein
LILLARRRAEDADTHTVTIHDYSVYVQKLPPDATSSELVDFFSQWGEVSKLEGRRRLHCASAALGSDSIQAPRPTGIPCSTRSCQLTAHCAVCCQHSECSVFMCRSKTLSSSEHMATC